MAFLDKIGKTITSTSKDVAKKTKDLTEIARLNSQISAEQKRIEETYYKIGKIYYEEYKDTSLENLMPLCNEIDETNSRIETYKAQVIEIKGILPCPNCGTELPNESTFCSKCGSNVKSYIEEQKSKASNSPKCPNCNADVNDDMVFCTECGHNLQFNTQESETTEIYSEETNLCPNCQSQIAEDMGFCTECGTKLN